MIITLSGSLGSGKSTVAKLLAKELGLEYVSTGAWFRELAAKRGMNVVEFSAAAENDPSIDKYIDDRLKSYNGAQGNYIIDSRMAPYFIENAVKLRLVVSDDEGARRIFSDSTRGEERFKDAVAAREGYKLRSASERIRYKEAYGVDIDDESVYDLVVDTTGKTPQQVVKAVADYVINR